MNRNMLLVLAGIFLAASLIFPIYVVVDSLNYNFSHYTISVPLDDTAREALIQEAQARNQLIFTITAIVEIAFTIAFLLTLRAIIKSPPVPHAFP